MLFDKEDASMQIMYYVKMSFENVQYYKNFITFQGL